MLKGAAEVFREIDDWRGVAWSFNQLGDIARDHGHPVEAQWGYEEGLAIFRRLADDSGTARSCADLGYLACNQHDYAGARARFAEALRICQALGHSYGIITVIEGFAVLAALQDDAERSLTLFGAAARLRKTTRVPKSKSVQALLDRALDLAWSQKSASSARSLWLAGAFLPLQDVIHCALESGEPRSGPATGNC
jgi:hypothetical protein